MGTRIPKQFLKIKGKTLIEWTIIALAKSEQIGGLYIGVTNMEQSGAWLKSIHPKVEGIFEGGETRFDTVLNGCRVLLESVGTEEDWLLVHDANRPLLTGTEVTRLIEAVGDDPSGGIVSLPVIDTLKSGTDSRIKTTLNREQCYRALTPQMFKLGLLYEALNQCEKNGVAVTDESQAMEHLGYQPKLVVGNTVNIKITTPADLKFAEAMLCTAEFSAPPD